MARPQPHADFTVKFLLGCFVFAVAATALLAFGSAWFTELAVGGVPADRVDSVLNRMIERVGGGTAPSSLFFVGVFTVSTVFALAKTDDTQCIVNVTGQQWWWECDYPAGKCGDVEIPAPIVTSGEGKPCLRDSIKAQKQVKKP